MPLRAGLLLSCCLGAVAGHAHEPLVGRVLPPYPDGLRELEGTCLSDSTDLERACDFGIAVLGTATEDGGERTLLHVVAQRSLPHDGREPRWEVTDAVDYPPVAPGYFLQVSTCRFDGADDARIAALVRHDPASEYSTDVAWARQLDFASGRLLELDPLRVDCLNEYPGE
ncbi:hypothetical protein [Luteimonas vadosa]|uniref:Uncharacterized protein n=1 Tax=Luteimonas vadosa TaxID=1165507 RepID=A0ABP9DYS9_9GAMM